MPLVAPCRILIMHGKRKKKLQPDDVKSCSILQLQYCLKYCLKHCPCLMFTNLLHTLIGKSLKLIFWTSRTA